MKTISAVLLFLFISTICAQNYPVKTFSKDGIKVVENPKYPKEGTFDLVLNEIFTLGEEKDNSKYIFSNPFGVDIDKAGNYYLFDRLGIFLVFDKNGKYIRRFGQKGAGPGDFAELVYFAITSDNKLVVNDGSNLRTCSLSLSGKYLEGITNNKYYKLLQLDQDNSLYAETRDYNMDKLSTKMGVQTITNSIVKYDNNSKKWVSLGDFKGTRYLMMRDKNIIQSAGPFNQFVWKMSPKNYIVTGFEDTYEFTKYNLDGKPFMKFYRDYAYIANRKYKEGSAHSRYLPAFTDYSCFDSDGNFWVNIETGDESGIYIYDIYSDKGEFVKQVYSKYKVKLFKGNLAVAFTKSSSGAILVKAFKYSFKKR